MKKLFMVLFLVSITVAESKCSDGEDILAKFEQHYREKQLERERKKTPLTRAAQQGDVEAVRSLLASNADVDQKDGEGKTALMKAAGGSSDDPKKAAEAYEEITRLLLKAGADIKQVDDTGKTLLMLALYPVDGEIYHFNEGLFALLVQAKVDVTRKYPDGGTVLDHAAKKSGGGSAAIDLLMQADFGQDHAAHEAWQQKVVDAKHAHQQYIKERNRPRYGRFGGKTMLLE